MNKVMQVIGVMGLCAVCAGAQERAGGVPAARQRLSQIKLEMPQPQAVRESTYVAPRVDPNYSAQATAFLQKNIHFTQKMAAAHQNGQKEDFLNAVFEAGRFYVQHLHNANVEVRLGAMAALAEMAANGYFDPNNLSHAVILSQTRHMALEQLQSKNACEANACQVKGMAAVLYAVLLPSAPPNASDPLSPLFGALSTDHGGEAENLAVAVYVFQAVQALDGARGVYRALLAFDAAKKKDSFFYRPQSRYTAEDYRVYIEAVEILAAAGEEGLPYLKQLAFSGLSLAARIHAHAELAYFPLSQADYRLNQQRLQQLFCNYTRDYDAYTQPLYRSVSAPTRTRGETLLERLAYAYGHGTAPQHLLPAGAKQCLPFVPHDIPVDVKGKELAKTHFIDLALFLIPVPGTATLKNTASVTAALARDAAAQAVRQGLKTAAETAVYRLGKMSFKLGGKRTGYGVMTKMLHYPPKEALGQLYKWGAKPRGGYLPRLRGDSYALKELDAYKAAAAKTFPAYPYASHPKVMYRGMALNGGDVATVAREGVLLEKVSVHNNTLMLSLAGGGRDATALKEISRMRFINITDNAGEAARYSVIRAGEKKGIPTVVQMKDLPRGSIIRVDKDIPASQIKHIDALLNIKGQNVWGRLEMLENGSFLFKPYR